MIEWMQWEYQLMASLTLELTLPSWAKNYLQGLLHFWKPDTEPHTYDHKTFNLDGCMDISFAGTTINTVVYIKMDSHDQFVLSEGVRRQLKIRPLC